MPELSPALKKRADPARLQFFVSNSIHGFPRFFRCSAIFSFQHL